MADDNVKFNTSFEDISKGIFGEDAEQKGAGTKKGIGTEQLEIDKEGILAFIGDILSGSQGLSQIFGAEQGAGLFEGSQATKETESLLAKIAGELAKVTGRKVTTIDEETTTDASKTSKGLKDQLGVGDISSEDALTAINPIGGSTVKAITGGF